MLLLLFELEEEVMELLARVGGKDDINLTPDVTVLAIELCTDP